MLVDILYVAWNRLEFTRKTFGLLVANTDWARVRRLTVYDDGSEDGTAQYLHDAVNQLKGVDTAIHWTSYRSPVAVMNDYVGRVLSNGNQPEAFVKLDNDIAVPPGWLKALTSVMDEHPPLDILGMQAGRQTELVEQGIVTEEAMATAAQEGWIAAPHIGGVGIMRLTAFQDREWPHPDGRFGFTAWQQKFDHNDVEGAPLVRGWVIPDVLCPQLDFLPFEPWASLANTYRARGWQRPLVWPPYYPSQHRFWDWMTAEGEAR